MCMPLGCLMAALLTLAVGYAVLLRGAKEAGSLKTIGNVIAWVIITISAAAIIFSLVFVRCAPWKACCKGMMGMGRWGAEKGMCHKMDMGMKRHMMEKDTDIAGDKERPMMKEKSGK